MHPVLLQTLEALEKVQSQIERVGDFRRKKSQIPNLRALKFLCVDFTASQIYENSALKRHQNDDDEEEHEDQIGAG